MITRAHSLILVAAAAVAASAIPASANDGALPGVDGSYSVVQPAPEPQEYVQGGSPYGEGFVLIPGTDTYLKVSGMIRYDVDYRGENKKKQ